jgi:hypothetical protein
LVAAHHSPLTTIYTQVLPTVQVDQARQAPPQRHPGAALPLTP